MFDKFKRAVNNVAKESLKAYYEGRYELDAKARRALDTLRLDYETDFAAIKQQYRLLSKRYHPDNRDTGDNEQFLAVKAAYDVLKSAFREKDGNE